jgi:4-amino-4-deoxychorismate lyase
VDTLWLVNGERTGVDPADRGLAYGDGLFETMRAEHGTIARFAWHYDRLVEGCERLGFAAPARAVIETEIAAHLPRDRAATVKLIVTRGSGARGYRPPSEPRPTRVLCIAPWTPLPNEHYTRGIRVRTCATRLAENARLAGIKHLNRLEQVLAQREFSAAEAEQGLLLDASGRVVSGTSANVFAVTNARITTPDVSRCGIKGVMRRAVIAAAHELGLALTEGDLDPAALRMAEEIFVTNALVGIWPVAALDDRRLAVGPVTQRLMLHLRVGPYA